MSAEELEAGKEFGRYKDFDGDGIPSRTLPGTHPTKGAYFTRGTSRNPLRRLLRGRRRTTCTTCSACRRSSSTRRRWCPSPILTAGQEPARFGVIYYGSTSPSMHEALEALSENNIHVNALRVRGFPFGDELFDFVASHSKVFVVEQNRDAQLKTLLVNDAGINPANLISILHYDGTPITARFIQKEIAEIVSALNVRPIKKDKLPESVAPRRRGPRLCFGLAFLRGRAFAAPHADPKLVDRGAAWTSSMPRAACSARWRRASSSAPARRKARRAGRQIPRPAC